MVRPLLIALGAGGAAMVLVRYVSPGLGGAIAAAIVAGVAIVALGGHYHRSGLSQFERSRAGDNLYYLGLLFTLISLAYVLIRLFVLGAGDSFERRVDGLVGSFGIALSSTIVGILARIMTQSLDGNRESDGRGGRQDEGVGTASSLPVSEEDLATLRLRVREMTEALSHLIRVTLHQAEQTKKHTEVLLSEFTGHVTDLSKAGHVEAERSLRDTESSWREIAEAISRGCRDLLEESTNTAEAAAAQIERRWLTVADSVERTSSSAAARIAGISDSVDPLLTRLASLETSLGSFDGGLVEARQELGKALRASVDSTQEAISETRQAERHAVGARQSAAIATTEADRAERANVAVDAVLQAVQLLGPKLVALDANLESFDGALTGVTDRLEALAASAEAQADATGKQRDAAEHHAGELRQLAEKSAREADDVSRAREALIDVVTDLTGAVRGS